ncbi:SDR family oxidoreductase [Streptomyces sp. T12]|uniref:SDR family oxidoreductase n=1 Tax=Streptomyces sp. T12 TaxID=477697 RepID=UPI001C94918C|nr:NmrA family NAD(P)-binding protein [Streptomyces sp. T12]
MAPNSVSLAGVLPCGLARADFDWKVQMAFTTLVIGSTGTVGGTVVPEVLARGGKVRALVRRKVRDQQLPDGVELHVGDLTDERSVREALEGVQAAFYVSPHVEQEVEIAETFVAACEAAGVRLVFGGFHIVDPAARAAFTQMVPSYEGKLKVGEIISESDTNPVVLDLTNFAQNDEPFREDILAGVYPMPLHHDGANRIDLRDSGEIAAKILLDSKFPAGWIGLSGAEAVNGQQSADLWAEELGRPVRYLGDDTEAWHAAFAKRLTGHKLTDWISSFEFLSRQPIPTDQARVEATTELLGRAPRSYRDYVRDMAKQWQA